jgi:asparagine synthase (glutamine-hydrolysing)
MSRVSSQLYESATSFWNERSSLGALAIAVSPTARHSDAVRSMLEAAPHRGHHLELRDCGSGTIGISTDPQHRDAWLCSSNGTAAAFSGTLDNAEELSRLLADDDSSSRASDPASLLLRAYLIWRDEAFNRLRGSFTAVVANGASFSCARDHLGLRPLFYRCERDEFFAATEAKQVTAGAGISREPDLAAVEDIFYGRMASELAALRGVSRFPRASVAAVANNKDLSFRRYWNPEELLETGPSTAAETREQLSEMLERVIGRSVTGRDVISLSGGIDSPTIAAIAAPRHEQLAGRPLQALSSVYPDYPSVDERTYTELVADYLKIPLQLYVPSAQPLDDVQLWVDRVDTPVETLSVPELAENYSLAHSLGAQTVLTGELAEWVFTFGSHLIGHFVLHGRLRAVLSWVREQREHGMSWQHVFRATAPSLTPAFAARTYLRVLRRGGGQAPPWIDSAQTNGAFRPDLARPARRRWLDHQLDPILSPEATSFEADEICAAHCGVEVKRPLADVDLWELVLSLPAEQKFPSSVPKAIVRDVMRGRLPDEILDRKDKTGFSAWVLGNADWTGLRRWLSRPDPPITGVNYPLLLETIDRRQMNVLELMWAYDLARVHAFLDLWR